MPSHKLEELRYTQLDAFDRKRTLFTLVVSPLEEHGPHLPLGVDAFNAEYFADEITRIFLQKYHDWNVVRIPPLYVGSFVFDAAGSISIRPSTIRNLVADSLSSLAKHGFQYFLISNAHGGPTHVVALEEAARWISRRYRARAVSFSGHLIWHFLRGHYWEEMQEELNLNADELQALKEDAHAGQWETSMMLKLRPELVDPMYKTLPPFTAKLIHRIRPNYPFKTGNKLGYVGHPSRASEKFAEVSSLFLVQKAFQFIEQELLSQRQPSASLFYRIPIFRGNFHKITLLLAGIVAAALSLLLWLSI